MKKTCICISCADISEVTGIWNVRHGRWLIILDCPKCGVHQEAFITEPKPPRPIKFRSPLPDD